MLEAVGEATFHDRELANSNIDNLRSEGQAQQPVEPKKHLANKVPTTATFLKLVICDNEFQDLAKDSKVRQSTCRDVAKTSDKNLQTRMPKFVE